MVPKELCSVVAILQHDAEGKILLLTGDDSEVFLVPRRIFKVRHEETPPLPQKAQLQLCPAHGQSEAVRYDCKHLQVFVVPDVR